ncbi:MAG TPA: hypothetical protein VFX45_04150 [Solirubrobacterales bacterium]|nr:hypothetical protein [Solirubrobacterales bacterium]
MNGRRAIAGLCMLCALIVSAVAAQSAGAAGTTAYTCAESAPGGFSDAHCKTQSEGGGFVHKAINNNLTTELTGSNETTEGSKDSTVLKATVAGVALTISAHTNTVSGWMTNAEEGGEMFAHGEGTATKTEVTASNGCTVRTDGPDMLNEVGVVHTEVIKGTTKGQGDAVKFEPKVGTVLGRFILEGCTPAGLNGTYTVTGSVKSTTVNGATVNFTHADTTTQNTLKLNGAIKAGIEGTITFKSRAKSADKYVALSATT